jgi:hypothetical protein
VFTGIIAPLPAAFAVGICIGFVVLPVGGIAPVPAVEDGTLVGVVGCCAMLPAVSCGNMPTAPGGVAGSLLHAQVPSTPAHAILKIHFMVIGLRRCELLSRLWRRRESNLALSQFPLESCTWWDS